MKLIRRITAAALALCAALSIAAASADENISVYIDGNPLDFEKPPYTENDRVLVPMRKIFESLGCEVIWDEALGSVTAERGSDTVIMTIGSPVMYVNGSSVKLDVSPALDYDTTFVPLRAVSEALGCVVTWSDESESVFIVTPAPSAAETTPVYEGSGGVPDFGQIVGITPDPVLENNTVYCYMNVTPEMADKYSEAMRGEGYSVHETGEYRIYAKDGSSVLAGFRGEVFMVVITNY